jgi:hypothetical protein
MTDDRGGDVLSEDERATVRRLIDEINEFLRKRLSGSLSRR